MQEREQKTLVKKKVSKKGKEAEVRRLDWDGSSEEWSLVRENEIGGALEAGWGSGYDFKSNPMEDDD